MSDDKVETIESVSSGEIGRAVSSVRGQTLILDASARPRDDAFTNSEAFLASISSCGVTLIESYAKEQGSPVKRMAVEIEGVRRPAVLPACFDRISMRFEIAGVSQGQAEELVEVYRNR